MEGSTMYVVVLVITLTLVFLWKRITRSNQLGKPVPGPPLLEGMRVFVKGSVDNTLFMHLPVWAEKYGNIMQVDLLIRKIVLVNDASTFRRLVKEVELRDFTNDRPPTFFADHFFGGPKDIFLADFSPEWQVKRKIFHSILHFYGEGRSHFEQLMIKSLNDFTKTMKDKETVTMPGKIREYTLLLLSFLLDGDVGAAKGNTDKLMAVSDWSNKIFLVQNETLLQSFPFLSWIPGLPFKKLTDETWKAMENMHAAYFYEARRTYSPDHMRGLIDELFAKQQELQTQKDGFQLEDESIKAITVDIIAAAYLTTSSTLSSLFLYLIKHQDVQDRVYQEIKKIIGNSTPSFHHKQDMPYTTAVILETLRISSVVSLPIPHMTRKDISFDGFFIPKSTIVLLNVWYIHNRQDIWDDPLTFKPDRFLDADGQLLDSNHDVHKNLIPFGSGRRACPGENFGKSRIFLFTTFMIQNFLFLPDEQEGPLPSSDPRDWTPQQILCPENFKCKIMSRTNM